MKKKFIVIGIIVVLFLIVVSSSSDNKNKDNNTFSITPTSNPAKVEGVTMEKFNLIKEGMTYSEVVEILGSEGEVSSSSDMAGYKTVLYTWKGASALSNMNAMFQNDKMISKAQFGLK